MWRWLGARGCLVILFLFVALQFSIVLA